MVLPGAAYATVCSRVSIEIPQEMTLERIAFDAKMVITNNVPDKDLSDVRVDVTITDADGNVKNDLFFMRTSSMVNIGDVDGTGVVGHGTTAEIHWLIIPSVGAGGEDPEGMIYNAGATLTYTVDGNQEVVSVIPDQITVKPEAQLILDYFMPFEVIGDNPFTANVETPIPFPLAVRVLNAGFGPARRLKIDSAQPNITANEQGLLVDFRLLGASVNDSAVYPSLIVDIGTLDSKRIAMAYWEMISTLSGNFIDFYVTFTHDSELGGELTSILQETNAYYLLKRVKVNIPGRDAVRDFLADVDGDPDHFPDAIFESEIPGNGDEPNDARSPVSVVAALNAPSRPTPSTPEVELKTEAGTGWVYTRIPDPAGGMLDLVGVRRADGVQLDPNNFWVSEGLDENHRSTYTLHVLDYRSDAFVTGDYQLVYEPPEEDTVPPVTSLIFSGPVSYGAAYTYISPETLIIFNAKDNDGGSGVEGIYRKIVGEETQFYPAYPLYLYDAVGEVTGPVTLEYYSIDRAGNKEADQTAYLYVDNAAPQIAAFDATPSTFMPHAPVNVSVDKSTQFAMTAIDENEGQVLGSILNISEGSTFSPEKVVKSFSINLLSGTETGVQWDGKDSSDNLVPPGTYTARLTVSDGLDTQATSHTDAADITVMVEEWFKGEALDPNLEGEQKNPEVSGTRVVWQDGRNGNWDVFTKVIGEQNSAAITSDQYDQMAPSVDGDIIVWQDMRNGNWDIFGYDLASEQEFVVSNAAGNQERPVVSGQWVAWQDYRSGNWDIRAFNLSTFEEVVVTSHERDQIHPALSGTMLVWEDYRHGLGEIYTYDLSPRAETRLTYSIYNQTFPAISGNIITWTDQRTGQRDIYYTGPSGGETRITFGEGDHNHSSVLGDIVVYVDYEAGNNDPNLSFFDITSATGERLTAYPSRQEEPALGNGFLAWQDDRDGIYQIYWSPLQVEPVPLEIRIRPGFNLIAVGDRLATAHPTASGLITSTMGSLGIEKIVTYSSLNGLYLETSEDTNITLSKGMAIGVYATGSGALEVADSGETGDYTLRPGMNYVGMLTVPNGYTAFSLLASVGLDSVQSVRRFNSQTGLWETASVRDTAGGKEPVGVNFVINRGDGLIITTENRIDNWRPF